MSAIEHYVPPPNGFRTFLVVWATQSLSLLGTGITFFATIIWLTQVQYPRPDQKAELGFAISAVAVAAAIPIVFGAPLAGAWADRHDRRRTMIAMNVASGLVSLLVGGLMLAHLLNLGILLAITLLDSIFGAFHSASFDSSYAMLVPDEKLPRANGMMQTIYPIQAILAPSLAAGIVTLPSLAAQGALPGPLGEWLGFFSVGASLALIVDAFTFLVMAGALVLLHIPSPQRNDLYSTSGKRKSIWADVREGVTYILKRPSMLWLLGIFAVVNLASSGRGVFTPLMVKFNLAPDWSIHGFTFETALALLGVAAGLGELAGGIFISVWGGLKRGRVYGVLVPMIVMGIAQVVFGLSPLLYIAVVSQFVYLATYPIMNAHSQAIWQSQTPRALQGRVFSVRRLIAQFTYPLGTLIAGVGGGLLDPGVVMAALGMIVVIFCGAQLFSPRLLGIEALAAPAQSLTSS